MANNEISRCGLIFHSSVGILVIHSSHNVIRENHIHHLGSGLLNDMGGIYTLGEQPGTHIAGNHIHHIRSHNYGGWAIYCDEGSSYLIIEKNICHHTSSENFNLHYGRENLVRNNIFAYSGLGLFSISAAEEGRNALTLERNIFYSDGKPVLVARDMDSLEQRGFTSDLNCFFDIKGPVFAGDESRDYRAQVSWKRYSFSDLQALGYDRHSIIAAPVFEETREHAFGVSPSSPVWDLGFSP